MSRLILCALCVVAAAGQAIADPKASDIAGRWRGDTYRAAAATADCDAGRCTLTLDLVACGQGWCGVEVGKDNACGATALKLDAGKASENHVLFEGRLEIAQGTEPYVVQVYLVPAAGEEATTLDITGDTGGEFRIFRRSFPFHATLARAGDAVCRAESKVSFAD